MQDGLTFMHVSALAVIWADVYECLSAYGVELLNAAAPAAIWIYVSACLSVAGGSGRANVAVTRVSCTLRAPRRVAQRSGLVTPPREMRVCWRLRRSRCRSGGGIRGGFQQPPSTPAQHCLTRLATQGRGGFDRYRAFRRAVVMGCRT